MKRMLMVLAAVISAAAVQVVQAAVWTGEGDRTSWNDPNNWGGAVPLKDEDVTIAPAQPVEISIPSGVIIGNLTLDGATAKLKGTSWLALKSIDAKVAVDIDVPLNLVAPSGQFATFRFAQGGDVWQKLTAPAYKGWKITGAGVLHFRGAFEAANSYILGSYGGAGSTTGSSVHFHGKLTVRELNWGSGSCSGWCYLYSSDNEIYSVLFSYTTLNAMAENVFSTSQVLKWNDEPSAMREEGENYEASCISVGV